MAAKQILTNATTTDDESDVFYTVGGGGDTEMPIKASGTWDGGFLELHAKLDNTSDTYTFTGDKLTETEPYARMAGALDVSFKLILKNAGASTDLNAFTN